MSNEVLIDTNVVVKHLRRKPHPVTEQLKRLDETYISETVLGELFYGAYHGDQPDRELAKIDRFLQSTAVIYHDAKTAEIYGQITARLALIGQMIPTNDLWIAAAAMECKLPLATLDNHFQRVDGLEVEDWSGL